MDDRVLGGKYPISIGSALIFENNTVADIRKWSNDMYINLRTLYRNYVASHTPEARQKIKEVEFIQTFLQEVEQFEFIMKQVTENRAQLFFYYPTYTSINKVLPKSELKEYNPDGFDTIEDNLWEYVKQHGLMTPFIYHVIDVELPEHNKPIMLLSSFVIDLISSSTNFPKVTLLESYTGKTKTRDKWYTKLNFKPTTEEKKQQSSFDLPFNKFTLQIFGDKSGALKPADIKLRRTVRAIAKHYRWLPITTMDKIRYSIMSIKDKELKEALLKYL